MFAAVNTLIARVRREVEDALRTYEARIEVLRVAVATGAWRVGRLDVEIDYRVRTTNQTGNYVYLLLPGGVSPMTVRLPSTDARRAACSGPSSIRAGSAMVPGWGVAMAPTRSVGPCSRSPARFAEETSSRLGAAERDALAFYDTLDVPPPAPQAATATLVFVTEEARTTTTSAPLRVQVGPPSRTRRSSSRPLGPSRSARPGSPTWSRWTLTPTTSSGHPVGSWRPSDRPIRSAAVPW